jgi:hypothetical protein
VARNPGIDGFPRPLLCGTGQGRRNANKWLLFLTPLFTVIISYFIVGMAIW